MQYTTLGTRTGLRVSVLGFGAMRLPMAGPRIDRDKAIPMIHYAFNQGVNYIDTAVGYCNRDSQRVVGEALQGWRDQIVVSTKNHTYARKQYDTWHRNLEDSLKRLKTDHIDIYNLHGLNLREFKTEVACKGGSYEWMQKAKDEGLIRHICFSFHDTPEALKEIAQSGMFDSVTCQYNILNPENASAFKEIKRQGMGIIVMGPVGGGRLGVPSDALRKLVPGAKSVPEVAMRFVLATPEVDVSLSGMSTMAHVKENCRVCSRKTPLSTREKQNVKRVLNRYKKLAKLYCTGCGYCMPCPSGVNIPANFDSLNQLRVYDLEAQAKATYARQAGKATLCIACGKCMKKCPQKIKIISQLRETVRDLDARYDSIDVSLRPKKIISLKKKGGKYALDMKAALECASYSDREASISADFSPAAGVTAEPSSVEKVLSPFSRASLPVRISGDVDLAAGIDVGTDLKSDLKDSGVGRKLMLAVARPGGTRGLALADRSPVLEKAAGMKRQSAASAHSADFALAYDEKSLRIRANVRDDRLALGNKKKNKRNQDVLLIDLKLGGLVRPRGEMPVITSRRIEVLLPPKGSKTCAVSVSGGGKMQGVNAKTKGGVKRLCIDVTIPWRAISCPPGRKGACLGLNVSHRSFSANAKPQIHSEWAGNGGWVVLL